MTGDAWNIPNSLTLLRILLIPLVVGVFYVPDTWLTPHGKNLTATIVFVFAALTDWLDGYLARQLNQTSAFEAFLDPVADKLMVAAALLVLVELGRAEAWVACVIIGREIAISALREWMAKVGAVRGVAVNMLGKFKTLAQMIAMPLLLYADPLHALFPTLVIGTWLVYAAAVLTLVSMVYYLKLAWPDISGR